MTRVTFVVGKPDCKFSYLSQVNTNFILIFDSFGKEDSVRMLYTSAGRIHGLMD